jgi:hypothetical protein
MDGESESMVSFCGREDLAVIITFHRIGQRICSSFVSRSSPVNDHAGKQRGGSL